MSHVQRALERVRVVHVVVRVPQLHAGVEVSHAVLAAPREDGGAVDVPRQVEDEIARADPCGKKLVEVFFGDAALLVLHAGFDRVGNAVTVVDEVDDGDARRREFHVANEDWHGRLGDGAATEDERGFELAAIKFKFEEKTYENHYPIRICTRSYRAI